MATAEDREHTIYYKGFLIDPVPQEHYDPPEKDRPWCVSVRIGRDGGQRVAGVSFTLGDTFGRSREEAVRMGIDLGKTIIDGLFLADRPRIAGGAGTFPGKEENPVQLPAWKINTGKININ